MDLTSATTHPFQHFNITYFIPMFALSELGFSFASLVENVHPHLIRRYGIHT